MNLVIIPVYKLDHWPDAYPVFQQMAALCAASFRENMADVDDVVILHNQGKRIAKYVPMFRDIFDQTHELFQEGHNLFFSDADALCVRPIKVFGEYEDFRLFSQAEGDRFCDVFPRYMLSGSRYFPQTMDVGLWSVGLDVWAQEPVEKRKEFGSHWDYEQYVYNHMFFSQPGMRENWEACIRNGFNLFYEWEDREPGAAVLSYNTSASWRGQSKMTLVDRLLLMQERMPHLLEGDDGDESAQGTDPAVQHLGRQAASARGASGRNPDRAAHPAHHRSGRTHRSVR